MVKLSPEGYQNLGKLQTLIEMHAHLNARAWQCLMLMAIKQRGIWVVDEDAGNAKVGGGAVDCGAALMR